uniref:Uncharacterized protein n=1 Tax=Tetranychus urticae TaxID=32264 RepID=T1L2F3_TETUR
MRKEGSTNVPYGIPKKLKRNLVFSSDPDESDPNLFYCRFCDSSFTKNCNMTRHEEKSCVFPGSPIIIVWLIYASQIALERLLMFLCLMDAHPCHQEIGTIKIMKFRIQNSKINIELLSICDTIGIAIVLFGRYSPPIVDKRKDKVSVFHFGFLTSTKYFNMAHNVSIVYGNCGRTNEATIFLDNAFTESNSNICVLTELIPDSIERDANVGVFTSSHHQAAAIKIANSETLSVYPEAVLPITVAKVVALRWRHMRVIEQFSSVVNRFFGYLTSQQA